MRARRPGWAWSSQIDLGNVSHSRVNDQRHVRCKGGKYADELWKKNLPERGGLEETDLEERVKPKIVAERAVMF